MLRFLLVLQLATAALADDNSSDYSFFQLMSFVVVLLAIFACIIGAWGMPVGYADPPENSRTIKHVIVIPPQTHTAYYRREQGPLQEC